MAGRAATLTAAHVIVRYGDPVMLAIEPGKAKTPFLWVVQSRWPDGWRTEVVPAARAEWLVGSSLGVTSRPSAVWVSSVDRVGNQPAEVALPAR